MKTRSIRTAEDYAAALKEVDTLMSAAPGTKEGERLDFLANLVQAYESKNFPIEQLQL